MPRDRKNKKNKEEIASYLEARTFALLSTGQRQVGCRMTKSNSTQCKAKHETHEQVSIAVEVEMPNSQTLKGNRKF
jgi:uncharacterized protein YaiE (UPF0345 family)